ncbi:cytidine deaminase-like protein [Blastocladiella britannica]|nr:cytidine deaminase-like protein [Blastocladiella britannica]
MSCPPPFQKKIYTMTTSVQENDDRFWMRAAIAMAHKSAPVPSAYCVGAVLVAPVAALESAEPVLWAATAANSRQETTHALSLAMGNDPNAPVPETHVVLSTGYSREIPGNTHAEEVCFLKLGDQALALPDPVPGQSPQWPPEVLAITRAAGATVYTTMEPCSKRLSGRCSCTDHALALGVKRVVVGIAEPRDIFVQCEGIARLGEAGVQVTVLEGMEEECWAPNRHIRPRYASADP